MRGCVCSLMTRGLPLQPCLRVCLSVCVCACLSAHSSVGGIEITRGWVEKQRKRRGRAERQGEGETIEREEEGGMREREGKGNLATVTFCSGLDIWIPSSFAASLLCVRTRTHSTADDNVCWGKVSYAVLRITYLFLHGAANFERGFWNGHWTSELTSCVWTFVCVFALRIFDATYMIPVVTPLLLSHTAMHAVLHSRDCFTPTLLELKIPQLIAEEILQLDLFSAWISNIIKLFINKQPNKTSCIMPELSLVCCFWGAGNSWQSPYLGLKWMKCPETFCKAYFWNDRSCDSCGPIIMVFLDLFS